MKSISLLLLLLSTTVLASGEPHSYNTTNNYYTSSNNMIGNSSLDIAKAAASGNHHFDAGAVGYPIQWSLAGARYEGANALDFALFKRLGRDGLLLSGSTSVTPKEKLLNMSIGGKF